MFKEEKSTHFSPDVKKDAIISTLPAILDVAAIGSLSFCSIVTPLYIKRRIKIFCSKKLIATIKLSNKGENIVFASLQ